MNKLENEIESNKQDIEYLEDFLSNEHLLTSMTALEKMLLRRKLQELQSLLDTNELLLEISLKSV